MEGYSSDSTMCRCILCVPLWVIMIFILFPQNAIASDIIGDINDNGVVNLEEAVYALQVSAGLTPSTLLDPDSEPRVAAWGTYTYGSDVLTITFTFSNFSNGGPPVGTFPMTVTSLTEMELSVTDPGGEPLSWTRESGDPGDIVGEWESLDPDGNLTRLILDANGSLLFTAKGPLYTDVIDIPKRTISIDGSFGDWAGINEVSLYDENSDCGSVPGRSLEHFYVAYDDNYIYIRMDIFGLPDPLFDYKFGKWIHSRVTPPPSSTCYLSSNVCQSTGCSAAFGSAVAMTANVFEARIDKCLVEPWDTSYGYPVWIDQGTITECRTHYMTSRLNIDYSSCD